jgi:hypothetical protein
MNYAEILEVIAEQKRINLETGELLERTRQWINDTLKLMDEREQGLLAEARRRQRPIGFIR